jgi:hypothetical protein
MSEMKPLLDSELPADLASVLRSAEGDGPEEHEPAQKRALAAVAAHRAAASSPRDGGVRTGSPFAKVTLALVLACTGGAALVSHFASTGPSGGSPTPASAPGTPTLASEPSAPPDEALGSASSASPPSAVTASPQGVRIDDLPPARVEGTAIRKRAPSTGSSSTPEVELEDGLALIDSARAALAAKRPASTLAAVETYRRRFRGGHFEEEADVLEIQALVALGRRDEAKAKGERFIASHPASAYTRRAQSALASEVTP